MKHPEAFMVLHAVERSMRLGGAADARLPPLRVADLLKASQAAESQRGVWRLAAVPTGAIPPPHRAEAALRDALARWDPEAADAAVHSTTWAVPSPRTWWRRACN